MRLGELLLALLEQARQHRQPRRRKERRRVCIVLCFVVHALLNSDMMTPGGSSAKGSPRSTTAIAADRSKARPGVSPGAPSQADPLTEEPSRRGASTHEEIVERSEKRRRRALGPFTRGATTTQEENAASLPRLFIAALDCVFSRRFSTAGCPSWSGVGRDRRR